jgi:hypothetical protein
MKRYFLLFTLLILLAGCETESEPIVFLDNLCENNKADKEVCETAGGEYIMHSNGCVDSCYRIEMKAIGKSAVCTMSVACGCDCGDNQCWDGTVCIDNDVIVEQAYQERCETAGGEYKEFGDACGDSCISAREDTGCEDTETYACDCGDDLCWNGENCELN